MGRRTPSRPIMAVVAAVAVALPTFGFVHPPRSSVVAASAGSLLHASVQKHNDLGNSGDAFLRATRCALDPGQVDFAPDALTGLLGRRTGVGAG